MDEQLEQSVNGLEHTLGELLSLHEQLLQLMQEKRKLLRSGDAEGMTQLCQLENEKLQAVSEREKERLQWIGVLTERLQPEADEPMRLTEIAEALPEPARGRLLARRQQLRQRMEQVREQTSVARKATESLLNHVNGLVQTVTSLASHAATYDPSGGTPSGGAAVRTLNVTA
jgi:hypothetical protein